MKSTSKELTFSVLCLLLAAGASGCGQTESSSADIQPETDTQTTAATEAAETETTAAETEAPEPVYDYVHGDDGYFSLTDSGLGTPVKVQGTGTCWAIAASSAIESGILVNSGKTKEIDPDSLLNAVYNDEKAEGWFLAENLSKKDLCGRGWMVVEALADGIDGMVLTEANDYENCDPEFIKESIRTKGAISVGVPDKQAARGFFGDYQTFNQPDAVEDNGDFDHDVTIIGWDDHFPKEYFRTEASQDGAWLVQNSRFEKYSYYWFSYDTKFLTPYGWNASEDYGEVISYDGGKENHIGTGDETSIANVFHHAGSLTAVGTYTTADNQKITIEIRDAAMENVLYSQDAEYPVKGYHLTDLEAPQDVTDYAIVIRFAGDAPVEGDGFSDEFLSYHASAEAGQSFVLIDDKWADLSLPETAEALKLDFTPNNACIKAVYAK